MDGDTLVLRRERHPPFLSPAVPEAVVSSVFETDHVSNNPVESIVDKVSVLSLEEWKELSEEEQNRQFFCESFYSTKTGYIHPLYGGSGLSR